MELLQLFGIEHNGTIAGIVRATQAAWYREGRLRTDIQEEHGYLKDEAMPLFRHLGFIEAITPEPSSMYEHALLLGGTIVAVRKRLAFLARQWDAGVRFEHLALLGGPRALLSRETDALFDSANEELAFRPEVTPWMMPPTTEIGMMKLVFYQSRLPMEWRGSGFFAPVDTPLQEGSRNPNTGETIEAWLACVGDPGDCLVVSSQPYVKYQEVVAQRVMVGHSGVYGIGGEAPSSISITALLDNLAKTAFEW